MRIAQLSGWLALAGMLLLCACPQQDGSTSQPGSTGGSSTGTNATTEPGIDFQRKNAGMPVTTMDYISEAPDGLAGSSSAGIVTFAVVEKEGGESLIYQREVASHQRSKLAQIDDMAAGSLSASSDGQYLVYCRQRNLETYIDDPGITYPKEIGVVRRYSVVNGQDDVLFDFRSEPFRAFRNNQLTPHISSDGSFVVTLSYDMDHLLMARMLSDWLAIEADYRSRQAEMTDDERLQVEDDLRRLTHASHTRPWMEEQGVELTEEGPPSEEEREAMRKYYEQKRIMRGALLIWEDGNSRVLELDVPEEYNESLLYIVAAGHGTVVIWPQPVIPDPSEPHQLFTANLESGKLEPLGSVLGTPSTFELTSDGSALLVLHNPTDVENEQVLTETRLLRIPLDGSEPVEKTLLGDYLGVCDVMADGAYVVGQDRDDIGMFLEDVAAGQRAEQLQLADMVSGVFGGGDAAYAVFLDAGIMYSIPLSMKPKQEPGYIQEDYFSQFEPKFNGFLENLGFTVPDVLISIWEERMGLGTHEVSVQYANPETPGVPALMRYSVLQDRVVAVWFPQGYPFTNDGFPLTDVALDYYEVKDRADAMLGNLDWLSAETRQVFQPGENPLYDGRTDSYILIYRDGYWLDEEQENWAINSEVTMRLHAFDGSLAEISITHLEPVYGQPLKLDMEQAKFSIRNKGDVPIPEDAPVRFDTDNVRLVLDRVSNQMSGPAGFELGGETRICYEIDAYIQPEDELIASFRVDTVTGDILGQLDFQPTGVNPMSMERIQ